MVLCRQHYTIAIVHSFKLLCERFISIVAAPLRYVCMQRVRHLCHMLSVVMPCERVHAPICVQMDPYSLEC